MTSSADLGVDPRERWAGLFKDTMARTAADERADVLAFLDREVAKSADEATLRKSEGDHVGAGHQLARAMILRIVRNYIECGGHEGASR